MERVNKRWRSEGRAAFRIRIGLNSAEVLVGNVGAAQRFSYTVGCDGVNVAARLEGINKVYGTTICISDSVFEAVATEVVVRPLQRVQVKGREQEFMIYELLGLTNSDDPGLMARLNDQQVSQMSWTASRYWDQGDVANILVCTKLCSNSPLTPGRNRDCP